MEPLVVMQLRNVLYQRIMGLGNLNIFSLTSIIDAISDPITLDGKTFLIDIAVDSVHGVLVVTTDHPEVSPFRINRSRPSPSHYAPAITEIYGGEAADPALFKIIPSENNAFFVNAAGSLSSVYVQKQDRTSIYIKLREVGDDCMAAVLMAANSCKHNISAESFLRHLQAEVTETLNTINHKLSGVLYFTAKIDLRGGLTSGKIAITVSLGQYCRTTNYSWDETATA